MKDNQILIMVLIVVVSVLYLFSGTSDQMDTSLTAKQQRQIVATWGEK